MFFFFFFFLNVDLVSNYHGFKGEIIKLMPYYMINIIYQIVNPLHLKKLEFVPNIKNIMFQVTFIIYD